MRTEKDVLEALTLCQSYIHDISDAALTDPAVLALATRLATINSALAWVASQPEGKSFNNMLMNLRRVKRPAH